MDDKSKIANCKICTLAEVMKDCKNCPFNIGLESKKIVPIVTNKPSESK